MGSREAVLEKIRYGQGAGGGGDIIHLRDCHVTLTSHKSGRFRWELEMAKCGGVLKKEKPYVPLESEH